MGGLDTCVSSCVCPGPLCHDGLHRRRNAPATPAPSVLTLEDRFHVTLFGVALSHLLQEAKCFAETPCCRVGIGGRREGGRKREERDEERGECTITAHHS